MNTTLPNHLKSVKFTSESRFLRVPRAATPSQNHALVSTSISQNLFHLYSKSIRVKRPSTVGPNHQIPDRTATTIQGFSSKSQRNLRFAAVNACPELISQFGLTYHNEWPTDGKESKKHLNNFLVHVRKLLPDVKYLWIMEFQKRKAPHYHLFLTVPPNSEIRKQLAYYWAKITSPGDQAALNFHQHENNWIDWEMNNANYLAKYLDKEAQKDIPEGYSNFGRFWGASRDLVPEPETIEIENFSHLDTVDTETGEIIQAEKLIIRWLGRLAEKQTRGYSRFRSRASFGSYTMLQGSKAYRQIEEYLTKQIRKDQP